MTNGFHTKDIDKSYQICCQFLGKKDTVSKNYKEKGFTWKTSVRSIFFCREQWMEIKITEYLICRQEAF